MKIVKVRPLLKSRDEPFVSSLVAITVHGEMHGPPCTVLASRELPSGSSLDNKSGIFGIFMKTKLIGLKISEVF